MFNFSTNSTYVYLDGNWKKIYNYHIIIRNQSNTCLI